MKVLIQGNWATNKGDRAIIVFLIRELGKIGIYDITVSTTDPSLWEGSADALGKVRFVPFGWYVFRDSKRYGFGARLLHKVYNLYMEKLAFPLVRSSLLNNKKVPNLPGINARYMQALKEADRIINTGGHHITSLRSQDAVFQVTFDLAVAAATGKPYTLWSQSIGPLVFKKSKNEAMFKKLLQNAKDIFIRDQSSSTCLKSLNIGMKNVRSTYDSVFGLYDVCRPLSPENREKVLGISVFTGLASSASKGRKAFPELIRHAASKGYRITFFKMEHYEEETNFIREIIASSGTAGICNIVDFDVPVIEHIQRLSQCKMFIGHKTHSTVFSLMSYTPVLSIAYHPKSLDFMRTYGLEQYCIKDEELTADKLCKAFDDLASDLLPVFDTLCRQTGKLGKHVQQSFKEALSGDRTNLPVLEKQDEV